MPEENETQVAPEGATSPDVTPNQGSDGSGASSGTGLQFGSSDSVSSASATTPSNSSSSSSHNTTETLSSTTTGTVPTAIEVGKNNDSKKADNGQSTKSHSSESTSTGSSPVIVHNEDVMGDMDSGNIHIEDVDDDTPADVSSVSQLSELRASTRGGSDQTVATTSARADMDDNGLDEEEDEDLDETLLERLMGLAEMFPEPVRDGACSLVNGTFNGICSLYGLSRSICWVFFSSATILAAPIIFESERSSVEEMQRQQQRQILLGPGAAMPGGGVGMTPPLPPPPGARA